MPSGAFGKVCEGVWRDPATDSEISVAIKTLRSEFESHSPASYIHVHNTRVLLYT